MILPVSIGIYGRIASGIISPFIDFSLRETGCLSVCCESGVLDFHEVGIICDKIKSFCNRFKRHIAAVSHFRRPFTALACSHKYHTVGGA